VAPEPIRLADEVLKARQAVAEAQQILGAAEDATGEELGRLLDAV